MDDQPFAQRSSGVLLHLTSLPGVHGAGDLGQGAHEFASFLAAARQRWWQVLPVGPTGWAHSPYDSPSAFAGSPSLVALEPLVRQGLLTAREIEPPKALERSRTASLASSARYREALQRLAFGRFESKKPKALTAQFEVFCEHTKSWLDDYTLFTALKKAHRNECWTKWPAGLRDRKPSALSTARDQHRDEIRFTEFRQFEFQIQWDALRRRCQSLGVLLLGDLPIYVAHDGADTWAHREIFHLDRFGERRIVAGVPPDFFSTTGQVWGNPLYRWPTLARGGFQWWIERLRTTLERFDAVRLDHFIGFSRYWEIDARAKTAERGRFVRVPGAALFERAKSALGGLPMLAEDLGVVTPEVRTLRQRFGLPGMNILQFAFGETNGHSDYEPHRHERNSVVYTGTHDNDTTLGWFKERLSPRATPAMRAEARLALDYAGSDGRAPHWDLIRLALMSVANTTVIPMQDLLGLGSEARMNTPGTVERNWEWRLRGTELTQALSERIGELCTRYERAPRPTSKSRGGSR